jgi:hypothetical protein
MCNIKSWIRRRRDLVELYADYKAEALTFGVGRSIVLPNKLYISYDGHGSQQVTYDYLTDFSSKVIFWKKITSWSLN